jgi:hypothetical protein
MQLVVEAGAMGDLERTTSATKDAEFAAYMAARQPSLLRTAYLLTGDRHAAEDLVQTALAKLYLSWDKVQRRELLDEQVAVVPAAHRSSSRSPERIGCDCTRARMAASARLDCDFTVPTEMPSTWAVSASLSSS